MKQIHKISLIGVSALIPRAVLANAGTVLMWMPLFQLMFGNVLIGLIEGLVVSLIFKAKWYRSVLIMIGGNYASWLIGNGIILLFQEYLIDSVFQLKGVYSAWIFSLIILYFLTIIIELPFFNWIFKARNRDWKRSLKLSLIVNIFTYTAMILIYLSVSKYSFFTDLKVNQLLLEKDYHAELYLMRGKEIFKGKVSGNFNGELIYQIPDKYEFSNLKLIRNHNNGTIGLALINYKGDTIVVEDSLIDRNDLVSYPQLNSRYSNLIADFRDTTDRNWKVSAIGWAIDGLTVYSEEEKEENYAFEVPWMFWAIGHVSVINNNELICQIHGRLVLVNRETKEIAFITNADSYVIRKEK